jgi:hypothetical protein
MSRAPGTYVLTSFNFLTTPGTGGAYFSATGVGVGAPIVYNFVTPVRPATAPTAGQYLRVNATVNWAGVALP